MVELLTLSEIAYKSVKEHILSGEIRPGERVNLDKFASTLGMSATPVRESLTKLQQEGLICYVAHSGWRVSKLSRRNYLKYRELQILLEKTLAVRALPYVDENIINNMKASNERMREAIKTMQKDVAELGRIIQKENDEHFHMVLYRAYYNDPMINVLQNVWDTIKYQRMVMLSSPMFFKICCSDHEKIIDALEKKDLFELEETMNQHFANGPMCLESSFDDSFLFVQS